MKTLFCDAKTTTNRDFTRYFNHIINQKQMHIKQLENVFKLESKDRYAYLIKKVADFRQIFLIEDSKGNFISLGSEGDIIIPVWPELAFAQEIIKTDFEKCFVKEMKLKKFIKLLSKLEAENYLIGGFPNQSLHAIVVKPIEIKNHLLFECAKYK
uniref:DUF2750 domain-containing protein n=1 Tax=Flavobacterium sp. TaxID=239 RepID=UPI00404A6A49